MRFENLDQLVERVKEEPSRRLAVAGSENTVTLQAVARAHEESIAEAVLFGELEETQRLAEEAGVDLSSFELIEARGAEAAARAAAAVGAGEAEAVMKGGCSTKVFLRAVLDEAHGLRTGRLLSHVMVAEIPAYHQLLYLTDAALNIRPDLTAKVDIVNNAVGLAAALGCERPKVAALAAVEKVNLPAMPCTGDAAALAVMSRRGQLGDCVVDGPLAFDNAVSAESARIKGIDSEVAGDADILLCPDIEAANVLYKAFTYFVGARAGAVVVGAAAPVILPSRADSPQTKFLSIAVALGCAALS
ncbi:MAG: bifunctional enoyl-CoA hydratase/phosphate acetyltransferase [Candidatus Coatesbacteria bacterium]|nr:bifunctional enoyl-CoA hydratase/phosphate acetyltransferase [Candidatus Coatesbacteria bacterium]